MNINVGLKSLTNLAYGVNIFQFCKPQRLLYILFKLLFLCQNLMTLDDATKKKLRDIAEELLSSEETYVEILYLLDQVSCFSLIAKG